MQLTGNDAWSSRALSTARVPPRLHGVSFGGPIAGAGAGVHRSMRTMLRADRGGGKIWIFLPESATFLQRWKHAALFLRLDRCKR